MTQLMEQYSPGMADKAQIGMAKGRILYAVQVSAPDQITDAALPAVNLELAQLEN